jgi:hypothetical protein
MAVGDLLPLVYMRVGWSALESGGLGWVPLMAWVRGWRLIGGQCPAAFGAIASISGQTP